MASIASPYGLRPVKMLGEGYMNHGQREFRLSTNNSAAIYTGDVIQLSAAGNPAAMAATPTTSSAGVVGVCVGVRYSLPQSMGGAVMFGAFLPANAITAGYTDVWVMVVDNPDAIFQVQGSAAFGSLTNGANGAIGKNCAIDNFGGSSTTGNSTVRAIVGANGTSLAATNTLGFRVIGVAPGTENDAFPELLVKFNQGVHSYQNALGV